MQPLHKTLTSRMLHAKTYNARMIPNEILCITNDLKKFQTAARQGKITWFTQRPAKITIWFIHANLNCHLLSAMGQWHEVCIACLGPVFK
jgi:hypothetical protein